MQSRWRSCDPKYQTHWRLTFTRKVINLSCVSVSHETIKDGWFCPLIKRTLLQFVWNGSTVARRVLCAPAQVALDKSVWYMQKCKCTPDAQDCNVIENENVSSRRTLMKYTVIHSPDLSTSCLFPLSLNSFSVRPSSQLSLALPCVQSMFSLLLKCHSLCLIQSHLSFTVSLGSYQFEVAAVVRINILKTYSWGYGCECVQNILYSTVSQVDTFVIVRIKMEVYVLNGLLSAAYWAQ